MYNLPRDHYWYTFCSYNLGSVNTGIYIPDSKVEASGGIVTNLTYSFIILIIFTRLPKIETWYFW